MTDPLRCTCCNRVLKEGQETWLELNAVTHEWYSEGEFQPSESQGCFPFGTSCAKRRLKENLTEKS